MEFRPIVTGPSPQTPHEPIPNQGSHQFLAFDPEKVERKKNYKRRAASKDVSVDVPRQGADAPATDPVAHQLGLQLLASPHLAFVQQLLAQGNADNTSVEPIVRAFEAATAQRTHALGGDGIEAPTAPEAELSPAPKESKLRSQVDLKKGPAIKQEDKEREPVTTLKKKHNGPKLPETNAEPVNSDMVSNPSTDVDVQHSSRRKSRTSITMADVQMTLRGTRRKTSIQRKRQMEYEDDGDDEEEETLHMPAKKENGESAAKSMLVSSQCERNNTDHGMLKQVPST